MIAPSKDKCLDRLTWLSQGFTKTTGVLAFFLLSTGMIDLSNFSYHLQVTKLYVLKLFAAFSLASKSLPRLSVEMSIVVAEE